MEMEVENSFNSGEPDGTNDNSLPSKEEDSIFEEMRGLVQAEDDSQSKIIISESDNSNLSKEKENEGSTEKEDSCQADSNPQIQMEDLKVAEEEMNEVDVVVCGGCHNVYHFVEDLTRHKPQCTRKSNFRNNAIENKPQVWAFLLWKNAQGKHVSKTGSVVEESSWKLYQKWCKMPERIRNAWIAAGGAVMSYTNFGSKQSTPPTPPPSSPPLIHNVYPKTMSKHLEKDLHNGDSEIKPVVMRKLVQRDHTGEIKEIRSPNDPPPSKPTTLKDEIESIRNQLEGNDTSIINNASIENGGTLREEEFVVEKIVSRRFNPKKKQYEYLLKWEGYPAEQNTWEPAENLETCQHLLKQFEDNLAKQNIGKAKTIKKIGDMDNLPGPSSGSLGRPVRHSKQRALTQVKQWCGSIKPDDVDGIKRRLDIDSDEDDFLIKRMRMGGESDSEDSLMGPPTRVTFKSATPLLDVVPPVKRKVGRPPKNRNIVNGSPAPPPPSQQVVSMVSPNLAVALGLESDSEDSPLAVLNQRAAATRVSNLSPINQQVLVANAKGVVKVDPSQVPNLTSGVYIMSNKSIVKLDSVTPSKALALKEQQTTNPQPTTNVNKPEAQVVMIKNSAATGQKSGIIRKNTGLLKSAPVGRPPRPQGSIRITSPGSRLQSGIVPRSSVSGISSGIRPRGTVHNVRPLMQKKIEPEKKILIGSRTSGRGGGLKSGIHRKSSISKVSGEDLECKLRDWKSGETADIFEDLPESESSESDVGIPDDFPKDIGPIEPASPPRPLTLCPLTGKVLGKAEGEKTPEPTPPPSPKTATSANESESLKKDLKENMKIESTPVVTLSLPSQSTASSTSAKALFVNTASSSGSGVSSTSTVSKPLFVNTTSQNNMSSGSVTPTNIETSIVSQQPEAVLTDNDDDMVTITGEGGVVFKVSNSDLGSLLGGEDGEQCVYVTEGEDGDAVLALAQYPSRGDAALSSLSGAGSATLTPNTANNALANAEQQQYYIKQEASNESPELVTLQQESEEPQVIAQLVEASEPAPGGQRRVVLLLPDGNLMMTEVDEEQYAALELDK